MVLARVRLGIAALHGEEAVTTEFQNKRAEKGGVKMCLRLQVVMENEPGLDGDYARRARGRGLV